MAEIDKRYPENVPGPYYVDESCIACGTCMQTAPYNFKFKTGDKHAFVVKQPEDLNEEALCRLAMEKCPANAIGDNG